MTIYPVMVGDPRNTLGYWGQGRSGWPSPTFPAGQTIANVMPSQPAQKAQAEIFKNSGNEFRKLGPRYYGQAGAEYEKAIIVDPSYTDAYYNYAQLMSLQGNLPKAVDLMQRLLRIDPNDHDARVQLGDYYERLGTPQEAKKRYMEVLQVKPAFDPARRRLNYLLYLDQKRNYPDTSDALYNTLYTDVIHKSRNLLKRFFTSVKPNPVMLEFSQTLPIQFGETQKVGDAYNIAEYDHSKRLIRIDPQMMFSTPNVVAAYLAHELVHALDNDPYSSIVEEQDGYRLLAEFWKQHKWSESDTNLDRALELYQQSKNKLNQEVRRVYSIRNPDLPETSPGHGAPPINPLVKLSQLYDLQTESVERGLTQNS